MHRSMLLSVALVACSALVAFGASNPAHATDYTPPDLPMGWSTVGAAGALVQNQGTWVDASDAVSDWNTWTSMSKLSVGTTGCGTSTACIIYRYEGTALTFTFCDLPTHSNWAETHRIGTTLTDEDCLELVDGYEIFPISIGTQTSAFTWYQKEHIKNHELGHAIGLWDALGSTSCWTDPGTGEEYPLMKNNQTNCSNHGWNYTATYNEALYAAIRSGW